MLNNEQQNMKQEAKEFRFLSDVSSSQTFETLQKLANLQKRAKGQSFYMKPLT